MNVAKMMIYVFDRREKITGKGENAGYQHFLLFPQCFLKAFFIMNVAKMIIYVFDRTENIVGKGRKCGLPAFSPFPTMFSKGLFLRGVKSRDCVLKSSVA